MRLCYFLVVLLFYGVTASGQLPRKCKPERVALLTELIPEGSGLILWDNAFWTHNDSGDFTLFKLDSSDMSIAKTFKLPGRAKHDWEELAQDPDFIYLGDFGNNLRHTDTLQIQLIEKQDLLADSVSTKRIVFSWPGQTVEGKLVRRNFDCEAMVVVNDSIWLFTKEWQAPRQTQLFVIPRKPGQHVAEHRATIKTRLLVTGATFHQDSGRLVLCGYNKFLKPKLLVFDGINGTQSFKRKPTKVHLIKRMQVEGIASNNGRDYYIINEKFDFLFFHSRPMIHKFTLP